MTIQKTNLGELTQFDNVITDLSIGLATSSDAGIVKVNSEMAKPNYGLKIDDDGYAYVHVPFEDRIIASAWYDSEHKLIKLSVGSDILCIDIKDIVHEYKGDNVTIGLSGTDNQFYVKDGVYAKTMKNREICLDDHTLGSYLCTLTEQFGGNAI